MQNATEPYLVVSALESLHVKMVLGERLDMASLAASSKDKHGRAVRTVRTQSGREISAGVVVRSVPSHVYIDS